LTIVAACRATACAAGHDVYARPRYPRGVPVWKDRSIWVVLLLALAVVLLRSIGIAYAHSESIDDDYHLVRGVRFLTGTLKNTPLNDPTLGETILSLPLWLTDCKPWGAPRNPTKFGLIIHNQRLSPETITMMVAVWKAILFSLFVPFVFACVRGLYNVRAAWVAVVIMLIEPTISAHVTPAALDLIGFQAIAVACWLWWRYFERPGWGTLAWAAGVSGAAMLVKHTAIVLPFVAMCYAALWMFFRRGQSESVGTWWRTRWTHALAAPFIAFVALTIFSGGFAKVPRPESIPAESTLGRLFEKPLPAGLYFRSLQTAAFHGEEGHPSWFMGQRNDQGSIWYYPVVALYKVPIPLIAFVGVGIVSLLFVRPRFREWALVVPMVLLFALIVKGGINIGFRHAIPAYAFLLMLCTRSLLIERRAIAGMIIALLAVTTVDVARWYPNLISYINFPRHRVWLEINDSNLDWGQGLKQIRNWIDANATLIAGRPVYVRAFGLPDSPNVQYYLQDRAIVLTRNTAPPPGDAVLITSPLYVVGLFEGNTKTGALEFLKDKDPIAVIGAGSNLVFEVNTADRPAESTAIPDRQ
jgi:Dolichyl-phosphate-mannose-protein mannosyltransferase